MIDVLQKLLKLFDKQERRQFYWLLPPMIFSGIADIVGIALVVPFMAVVVNPAAIQQSSKLRWLYQHLKFTSPSRFLVFLGITVLVILIVGNTLSAFVAWLSLNYANTRRYNFNQRLLKKYFYQPYVFFLNRHGSDLGKNILNEVNIVINAILMPVMQNIAKGFGVVFILLLLLVVNPGLAISVAIVLGCAFVGVFAFFRQQLSCINQEQYADYQALSRVVHEGFGGIKEIKLLGKEESFLEQFSYPAKRFAKNNTAALMIGQLPRYALETIAFGGVLIMVVYLLLMKQTSSQIIPLLALFAFACYRLMPALQLIFSNLSLIRSHQASLDTLCADLAGPMPEAHSNNVGQWLPFTDELKLNQVSFAYPGMSAPLIQNLSLAIKAKTTVGFVGSTGAGKTTLIDMILGLLMPSQGTMSVDGITLTDANRTAWQKNLGYVPQHIFLCDETVAKNIAFGVPETEIDLVAVERAARIANLHDFIEKELPEGYQTFVGERGVRLSGGQRQRIGIARALYHNPEVLVLDEATSALDSLTETAIMEAIHTLAHKKTIIIIAHRLTTVEQCDVIYLLAKGAIVAQGAYADLINKDVTFQQLAKVINSDEKKLMENKSV